MRYKNLLLVFACFLTIGGCLEGPRPPVKSPAQENEKPRLSDTAGDLSQVNERFEREFWQKPDYIVRSIGDLKDKVIADIGSGRGYFTFRLAPLAKKVIAIDIDPEALQFIEHTRQGLDKSMVDRIETRLAEPHDPKLKQGEADIILMVNTYMYIEKRVEYLQKLMQGISEGGRIIIIDFKKRNLQVGPPTKLKLTLHQVETELNAAGWKSIKSDDTSLEFQYIVVASAN